MGAPLLYELTDHVCRVCFGRVLMHRDLSGAARIFTCSNCGAAAAGKTASSVCACGLKLKNGRDAGLRCERNANPTPEFPSEVVASQTADT